MRIGIPREMKKDEFRVAALPDGVRALAREGHQVWVEKGAGEGCGHADEEYEAAGAVLASRAEVWKNAELLYKVKEPLPEEWPLLRPGLAVFAYFHFAAS